MTRLFRHTFGSAFLALAFQASAQTTDYKGLHNMLIQFYGYQRAGDKTIDNKNPFYKTAPFPHSNDNIGGKDLSSGWYDAGDFVKFGLPFSYSAYCLLKGYDVFPRGYDDVTSWDYKGAPDNIPDILGEVKIATDYMMKAVVSSTQIVVDVGNAGEDHKELSEDGYKNSSRVSNRTVYATGGADVAGLYAASLALMAQVYKKHDAAYAASCLAKAKEAFTFAVANQKLSTQQNNGEFYKTTTYNDKLACGAVELYRATGEETYLTQAKAFQAKVGQHFSVLGYAYVGDLSAFELKRLGAPADGPWLSDVAFTMSRVATGPAMIKGAYINSDWGNAGKAATAGFSAALAFMVSGDSKYLDFARSQTHWVAGIAPFTQSYVVGFGNGPTAPHHRNDVAKLNGVRLKGGVVSGPSPSGGFDPAKPEASSWSFNGSDAANYKNTEVALDYNAGMVGVVAFLRDYDNPPAGQIRITTPLAATPGNVDLNTGSAAFSAAMTPSGAWKLVLKGRTSKAKTTLTGTGTAIAATWTGVADSGSYMLGEAVDVSLDVPNIASYHLIRASTSFYITGLKKEAFKATDIVVDDFEDLDAMNKVGGSWEIFTDKPTGTSSTSPAALTGATGAIAATVGEADSKGLSIRLVGGAGATRPFAGIRTTFNAAGTPVSLGASAASVVCDIKAAAGAVLMVELEQTDVADGAYPARKLEFATDSWNRFRLPLSSFVQPDWKTTARAANPGSVTGLRFTYYGTSNVRFNLDNVRIENLSLGAAPVRANRAGAQSDFTFVGADKDGFSYQFRPAEGSPKAWTAEVMDIFGRVVAVRALAANPGGKAFRMPGVRLGPGLYFIRHTAAGEKQEYIHRIRVGVGVP